MRTLSAQELVSTWEAAETQHPVDRALTMLSPVDPQRDRRTLAALSVGARDALLLSLRERTFGSRLDGVGDCPACGVQIEFSITVDELRAPAPNAARLVTHGELELEFRPVDSFDLVAIASAVSVDDARAILLSRCVSSARRGGETVDPRALPADVVAALEEAMQAADPQADVRIAFDCPSCAHRWRAPFDIAAFFWTELRTHARRLLQDVAELARAFAWSEAELLAMTAERRAFYLQLVRA